MRTVSRSILTVPTADTLLSDMANCIRCGRQLPPILFGKKICQWCVQHEAAQRGEVDEDAKQPVIAAPWVRSESSITAHASHLRRQRYGLYRDGAGQGPSLDFTGKLMVHFGANFGPYHAVGRVVAIADLHVPSWRHHAHRLQHVVPVGPGCALRIALRTLDFRRHLSDHGHCGGPSQCGMESQEF